MNPIRVIINAAGRARAYDCEQMDNSYSHWLPTTIGKIAAQGRVSKQAVHAFLGRLSGSQVHDITSQVLFWQAKRRLQQKHARRARLGIKPMTMSERSRLSWIARKRNAEARRQHITSLRAVGAAPDPLAEEAQP